MENKPAKNTFLSYFLRKAALKRRRCLGLRQLNSALNDD
jgi:uncharacterized protein YpiB (UPF0302 family)